MPIWPSPLNRSVCSRRFMISFLEKKIISNRQRKAPGLRLHGIPALFVRSLRICGYG